MKVVEILKLCHEPLKMLSKTESKVNDWQYVELYDDYMEALSRQQEQLRRIEKGQNWAVDFGSDVAANFLTDGLIWLGSRLFRKL